ncbi:MAG: galactose mutarotase [Flavobacteria bacterium RIFCSPLOWO2_12_FULL_35_11]|nr:MAG: galactose mutarotase [Flavobacteria bacterium RIFCSPLOWO2_12_FULL_35_11]
MLRQSKRRKMVIAKDIQKKMKSTSIEKTAYGTTPQGENVDKYTLKNLKGMEVGIITYGGIITSLIVPNKNGLQEDVVLGYDSLEDYTKGNSYFGAIIGRFGNRIAKGKFILDGVEYKLAINNGPNHLHGGVKGFDKVIWNAVTIKGNKAVSVKLSYLSKDMEEGYPGNLKVDVTYTITNDNILEVLYEATTDKKTILNLTQHSYFNLSANFSQTILDHEIIINADVFIPVDETLIPMGKIAEVTNTPFDFRKAKIIGKDIGANDDQLKKGSGYDHCWILKNQNQGYKFAASAYHPESGRLLEVFTDEPGMQFYTGNFLDGIFGNRAGFCFETQHYPDAPNQKNFPSTVLTPGEKFSSKTAFKFSVK